MTVTTMTVGELEISPYNVRTNHNDQNATDALEASILAKGQLLPLVVHPMKGRKGMFGVFAGGRRFRSFKRLVERGDLRADWPIDVVVRDLNEAELIELSLAENILRRELHPYEIYAAIARAVRRGSTAEQIAADFGQEVSWVRQNLRLGQLAPEIFAAYAKGQLSTEQAKAYAATEDQALQLQVFAALSAGPSHAHHAVDIRAAMKVGDREAARLLRFVGDEAYRIMGGRFELDLFADGPEERGRVVDEVLLRELAESGLTAVREEARHQAGREVRFVAEPPRGEFGTEWALQITPALRGDGTLALPDGDVVARLRIDERGEAELTWWWASRKAKATAEKPGEANPVSAGPIAAPLGNAIDDRASPGMHRDTDAALKQEAGLSRDAIQIFRSMRREIMRALLVADADAGGNVATDYLVWSQLRMLIDRSGSCQIGAVRLQPETVNAFDLSRKIRDQIDASDVSKSIDRALQELTQQSFCTGDNLSEAFRDYHASSARLKNMAAAIVAGLSLLRSLNAPGYALPIHDTLIDCARANDDELIREIWKPTAELIDLIPKAQRLAIVAPMMDAALLRRLSARKAGEITSEVTAIVTDHCWVHPLLKFTGPDDEEDPGANDAAAELEEAAE